MWIVHKNINFEWAGYGLKFFWKEPIGLGQARTYNAA